MDRISRNDYYLLLAKIASLRSTCSRGKNGCVLVDAETNRVVSIGYNGSPKGAPHCDDEGCMLVETKDHGETCIRTIHAEIQAIAYMRGSFNSLIAYCTSQPCFACLKALVSVNVKDIYYVKPYLSYIEEREMWGVHVNQHRRKDIGEEGWKKIGSLLGYSLSELEKTQ